MSYTKTIIILLVISFVAFLAINLPDPIRIEGDGVFYYSWLRSSVFDRDFDFLNELEHFSSYDLVSRGILISDLRTYLGKISNPYAYGTAVLWSPLFLVAHLISLFFSLDIDGYSGLYVFSVNLSSWLFGSVAWVILYVNLKKFFRSSVSFWSSSGIYLATPWVYYQFFEPAMSHMASLFIISVFLHLIILMYQKKSVKSLFFVLVVFLMLSIRWQNLLFCVAYLPIMWLYRDNIKQLMRSVFIIAMPIILFWLSQSMIWYYLYGKYILIPQGTSFVRPEFHGLYILFSSNRGLLLWSPIIIFSLFGFYYLWHRSRFLFFIVSSTVILQWLINGSLNDLGGGDAYGARRFIATLPFLVLALAAFWDRVKIKSLMYILTILFIVFNIILIDKYRSGDIPHHGEFNIFHLVDI